uniref:Integrase_H2C2 domain-containing protein n=1 Tax=Anopheles minimus TaxID=112268 RepID=A0A182VT95_9DIPT
MQHLWIAKNDWDDPVTEEVNRTWSQFREQLYLLTSIKVARHAFVDKGVLLQLHCFCDASEAAYGACVYARSVDADGTVKVELLTSKSRPAPLKLYCLRFIRRCQGKMIEYGFIKCNEYAEAKQTLIRALQRKEFNEEIGLLLKNQPIPANSKLKRLRPFVDKSGILRVGGRLRNADMKYAAKHPMILPGKCHFSRTVAVAYHEMILHAGPQLTLAALRQEFWPLNGKTLVSYICRGCHTCFKTNPATIRQPPGQMPKQRISPSRPFSTVGVDYCGPMMLRQPHRKSTCQKAYVAIFVCFFSKAVHIEIVED